MNILFYCSEYPPAISGGIGSVTKILAEELVKKGHKVFVVGFYNNLGDIPEVSVVNGVEIIRLTEHNLLKRKIAGFCMRFRVTNYFEQQKINQIEIYIQSLIEKEKIDVFETPDFFVSNCRFRNLHFRKFSVPTVLRIHGSCSFLFNMKGLKSGSVKKNDARHFSRCDYISSVSQFSMDYVLQNFDVSWSRRNVVIYNPIENSFLKQCAPSDDGVILFVGKLVETKGCYSLVKAFNLIADKYSNIRLRLVGGGNQDALIQLVEPKYRNRVEMLGFCDRSTIAREIENCAFACIPSYFENFSIVALEIMAKRRALIYTERTSGREIIDNGIDGILVNPEDVNQIAEKMSYLIENRDERNRIGEAAYIKIESIFAVDKIVGNLISFYSSILKNDIRYDNQ